MGLKSSLMSGTISMRDKRPNFGPKVRTGPQNDRLPTTAATEPKQHATLICRAFMSSGSGKEVLMLMLPVNVLMRGKSFRHFSWITSFSDAPLAGTLLKTYQFWLTFDRQQPKKELREC